MLKKQASKKLRTRLKIVGATLTAIFSLFAVFTGTLAWFQSFAGASVTGASIRVEVAGDASIDEINLIKFDYSSEIIGGVEVFDYIDPSTGEVSKYVYNPEYNDGAGSFGYYDNEMFVPITTTMNIYDPVEKIVRGGDLINLNCNTVYEISFTSTMTNTSYMQLYARLLDGVVTGVNQILLSDCVDIDVYFESDLSFSEDSFSAELGYSENDIVIYNGLLYRCLATYGAGNSYIPSSTPAKWEEIGIFSNLTTYHEHDVVIYNGYLYVCVVTEAPAADTLSSTRWNKLNTYSASSTYEEGEIVVHNGYVYRCLNDINSPESFTADHWDACLCDKVFYPSYKSSGLSTLETLYYKLSYISSLEAQHKNFYSDDPKQSEIAIKRNKEVEADGLKVYLNVNYAPSKADTHMKDIYNKIRALNDFIFDFKFTANEETI